MEQALTWNRGVGSGRGAIGLTDTNDAPARLTPTGSGSVVDDGDLVARARAGDAVAFERLFERYHAAILNYIHRMVGDRALAEDLTQDIFARIWIKRQSLSAVDHFESSW